MVPLREKTNLACVARSATFRLDAKQSAPNCKHLDGLFDAIDTFYLNEFLPSPFVKGAQPVYLPDGVDEGGALVISTLAVRPLSINFAACRRISAGDYDSLSEARKLRNGDVLLTTDGGTSIGKAAVFVAPTADDDESVDVGYTVDSHVAILRPVGISPSLTSFLLCSPMGQLQFQRAECGASGQTAVSEEDVRRFRFPRHKVEIVELAAEQLIASLDRSRRLEIAAHKRRESAWDAFEDALMQPGGTATQRIRAKARPSEARFLQLVGAPRS